MYILAGTHRAWQEQEARGYRWFWTYPPTTPTDVTPAKTYFFIGQEQPDHPRSLFRPGIQGPDVRVPVRDVLLITQELPWHPDSRFKPGVQGPNVRPPILDRIFVRQELPWHPNSVLRASIQGPDVRVPVRDWIIQGQQVPPQPWWRPQRAYIELRYARGQTWISFNKQEQPFHPPSLVRSSIHFSRPPGRDFIFIRQEQPFQALWPRPPLAPGIHSSGEFSFGYILG